MQRRVGSGEHTLSELPLPLPGLSVDRPAKCTDRSGLHRLTLAIACQFRASTVPRVYKERPFLWQTAERTKLLKPYGIYYFFI